MFEFMDDISLRSKALVGLAIGGGIATLVSRHFDKAEYMAMIAAADEEAAPEAVVDPTVPAQGAAAVNPQI